MRKKYLRACILWMMALLLVAAPALAQTTLTPLVLEGVHAVGSVNDTHLLIVKSDESSLYGVYDTQGTELLPCEYGRLKPVGYGRPVRYGLFEAMKEEGLNNHALLNAQGETVIDWQYAAFEVLSDRWCLAVVLEPTEGEVYDYEGISLLNNRTNDYDERYLVTRYDVYDLQGRAMVGTLERSACDRAVAHGEYLYVKDREGGMTAYDNTFTPLDLALRTIYDAYRVVDGKAVCLSDGSVLCEDASSVSVDTDIGLIRVSRGIGNKALYAPDGTLLVPEGYESIEWVYGDYVPVKQNGLSGLYDLQNGRLVVPCEYDEVVFSGRILDATRGYVSNGYACVKKDGMLGFVDMQGNVTCEPKYAEDAATEHGASLSVMDKDGTLSLIAADGVETKTDFDEVRKASGGDGTLLVVRKGESWGIADWHGEVVLPLEYKEFDLWITDCTDAVLVSSGFLEYNVLRVDKE